VVLDLLRERLMLLRAIDRRLEVFGAASHRYDLAPPLAHRDLVALEARLGAGLPEEYRVFVLEIGSEGAGPHHGLVAPRLRPGTSLARAYDPAVGDDGGLVIADHGDGAVSVLAVTGPWRGQIFAEHDVEVVAEASGFFAWYAGWLDRALAEWLAGAARRIAIDGLTEPAELEAIAHGFDLVAALARRDPDYRRALGYLHLRERRFDDAAAAFAGGAPDSRDELHDAGLALLGAARALLDSGDVGAAAAALEQAGAVTSVAPSLPIETRVEAVFSPIISQLRDLGHTAEADALAAHASRILRAN
jgi:hypothetical protein